MLFDDSLIVRLFTRRFFFAAVAGISIALFSFAMYLQLQLGLHPCPLCITQRVFVLLVGLAALSGLIFGPKKLFWWLHAALIALLCMAGAGVAGRHVWLQHLPEDQVPACGPGLGYLFDNFPLAQALRTLFAGDGNCAETVWTFLGLSIPEWTLINFIGLFVAVCIAMTLKLIARPSQHLPLR